MHRTTILHRYLITNDFLLSDEQKRLIWICKNVYFIVFSCMYELKIKILNTKKKFQCIAFCCNVLH